MKKIIIFDLDGTIVDTQLPFHASIEAELLRKYEGVIISPKELTKHFAEISRKDVFKQIVPGCDVNFLITKKWEEIYKMAEIKTPQYLPGIESLIHYLHGEEHLLFVASASPMAWIKICLKKNNLDSCFTEILSDEDVARPKQFSDVFLKAEKIASEEIQVAESELGLLCYVIGDGIADVEAGIEAGMFTFYILETSSRFDNTRNVMRVDSSGRLLQFLQETF